MTAKPHNYKNNVTTNRTLVVYQLQLLPFLKNDLYVFRGHIYSTILNDQSEQAEDLIMATKLYQKQVMAKSLENILQTESYLPTDFFSTDL